ncbi:hypothetical protein VTN96DRAFT_1236 [Rasamsonia emersonii]
MTQTPPYGRRLLPQVVDEIAASDPRRVWAAIPRDPDDLTAGYVDLTYAQYANAINRAAWWLEDRLGGKSSSFEPLAYAGPSDIRYTVFALAAMKAGYQMIFPSPRNSNEAHYAVLKAAGCSKFLHATTTAALAQSLKDGWPHAEGTSGELLTLQVPEYQEFLDETPAPHYPYEKTFDEAKNDPFLILHTSGTTGLPKPIFLTNGYCAHEDLLRFFPKIDGRGIITNLPAESRCFLAMNLFHAGGVQVSLLKGIFLGVIIVFPPPEKVLNADDVNAGIIHGNCDGCVLPPSLVEDMCDVPEFLDTLARMKYIVFGSAPLSKASGDLLHRRNPNGFHWMGQTETELLPLVQLENPEEDWQYFHFHPWTGAELRPIGDSEDLHELFIVRMKDPPLPHLQPVFENFPDLQEHSLKDLFSRHPTKPYLWRHRGRIDDVLVLSNGEKLNPVSIEGLITKNDPRVTGALVVGEGRFQPGLLLELRGADVPTTEEGRRKLIDEIWPVVEQANKTSPAYGQISKSHIIFASPEKPFQRTPKNTIKRKVVVKEYADEIAAMYAAAAQGVAADIPPADVHSLDSLQEYARRLVAKVAGKPAPDDDADIFALGVDSLQVVQMVQAIKALLRNQGVACDDRAVSPRLIYRNPTVRLLGAAIFAIASPDASIVSQDTRAATLQRILDRWTKDLPTPDTLPAVGPEPETWTVVLTGSTGSLGSYLLDALLGNPRVGKVICLNRSSGGADRQLAVCEARGLRTSQLEEGIASRVEFLQSDDLSAPQLGLASATDYERLLTTVTHVIHNAWPVNFNLSVESFDRHIGGVRRLVELSAASAHRASIFYVSSISSVAGWRGSTTAPEEILHDHSAPEAMGYGESKYLSERLLDAAAAASEGQIPASILRVGQIAGPIGLRNNSLSSSWPDADGDLPAAGKWNEQEWLPSLVRSSATLRMLPTTLGTMDAVEWVPVDVMARVIAVDLLLSPREKRASAAVYNLTNPAETSWSTALLPVVWEGLSGTIASEITLRDLPSWIAAVRAGPAADAGNPALKIIEFYENLTRGDRQQYATAQATAASPTLRALGPVRTGWMRGWMKQWGFAR